MRVLSSRRSRFSHWLIVALLISCVALTLISCSKKTSAAIIGKWRAEETKETVEFRKDGTLTSSQDTTTGTAGNTQTIRNKVTGTFTFTDSHHMDIQISTGNTNQPPVSISCEVRINGDKMSLVAAESGSHQQHLTNFRRLE
jgi:hypothetical protein